MTEVMHGAAAVLQHPNMNDQPSCLLCQRGSDDVPLITLEYRGGNLRICPQHLPVLIHDPGQLVGLLSGAEGFHPAEHRD
jgi:hypothetical protein